MVLLWWWPFQEALIPGSLSQKSNLLGSPFVDKPCHHFVKPQSWGSSFPGGVPSEDGCSRKGSPKIVMWADVQAHNSDTTLMAEQGWG